MAREVPCLCVDWVAASNLKNVEVSNEDGSKRKELATKAYDQLTSALQKLGITYVYALLSHFVSCFLSGIRHEKKH